MRKVSSDQSKRRRGSLTIGKCDSELEKRMPKAKLGKREWVRIRIPLSEAEKKMVKRQAKGRGLSVNAYIRSLIREYSR